MSAYTISTMGNVYTGEYELVIRPKHAPASPKRGIIYTHGREVNFNCFADFQVHIERSTILTALVNDGHTIISADLGGYATWGNNTVISRVTAAKNYLLTLGVLPTKVAMIGTSMGGLSSLNWAAANPTLITCFVGMLPVVNLTNIWGNASFTAEINTAYGGTYSEASFGATHNPITMASAGAYAGLPIQLWYGSTDTTVPPSTVTAFQTAVGANCTATSVPGGHAETTSAGISIPAVIAFIDAAG